MTNRSTSGDADLRYPESQAEALGESAADTDSDYQGEPYDSDEVPDVNAYESAFRELCRRAPVSQHSQIEVGHTDSNNGAGVPSLDSLELRQVIPIRCQVKFTDCNAIKSIYPLSQKQKENQDSLKHAVPPGPDE